eukprot:XP_008671652.1 uncharacterized protein LOC103649085 [Zea mays]
MRAPSTNAHPPTIPASLSPSPTSPSPSSSSRCALQLPPSIVPTPRLILVLPAANRPRPFARTTRLCNARPAAAGELVRDEHRQGAAQAVPGDRDAHISREAATPLLSRVSFTPSSQNPNPRLPNMASHPPISRRGVRIAATTDPVGSISPAPVSTALPVVVVKFETSFMLLAQPAATLQPGSGSGKRSPPIFSNELIPSSPPHHHHPAKRSHCFLSRRREVLLHHLLPLFLDMDPQAHLYALLVLDGVQ